MKVYLLTTSVCALGTLCLVAYAQPAKTVVTEAGCAKLALDSNNGTITSLNIAGQNRLASKGVAASGFSIWDHATEEGFVPLDCTVRQTGDNLLFTSNALELDFRAMLRPVPGGWEIRGRVQRTGGERFLSMRFGVPLDVEGWKWWQDILRTRSMHAERSASNAVPSGLGSGAQDWMPFGAISGEHGGLGYAVRMDEQWFHQTRYDADSHLFAFIVDFAMLDGHRRFAMEVPFRFYLFAPAGPWGLRGVVDSYFKLFPEWAEGSPDAQYPGSWAAWSDLTNQDAPLCDLGMYYHEGPTDEGYLSDDALGYKSLPYIEPSMYQQGHGDMDRVPTVEEAWARLEHNAAAKDPTEVEGWPEGDSRRQWAPVLASAILKAPILDAEGQRIAPSCGNWRWIGGSKYGAQFQLNLEPDIPGGVGEVRLEEFDCGKKIAGPSADGIYLDSYCAHLGTLDYSRANLVYSRIPPCFDAELRPCTALWAPAISWVEGLHDILGPHQQIVLPNVYRIAAPYPWHCFDVLGKECWVSPTGLLMAQMRAVGYHKIVTQLPCGDDPDDSFLKALLLLDVLPGGYGYRASSPSGLRDSYRKLLPIYRLLHRLGWQPITHAHSEQYYILGERYGEPDGPLAFVVNNAAEPRIVEVAVDAKALGMSKDVWLYDPLDETPLAWRWEAGKLIVSVGLDTEQTAVFVVGDAAGQSEFQRMWAADRLDDIALCMREYAYRNKQVHPLTQRVEELAAEVDKEAIDDLLAFSAALEGDDAITIRMRELAQDAAERLGLALHPVATTPQELIVPEATGPTVMELPLTVEFDTPMDENQWTIEDEDGQGRLEFADGNLLFELLKATTVKLASTDLLDFGEKPVEIEMRFVNESPAHAWYLGTFLWLKPPYGDDYLNVRIDNGNQIRMENGQTAASNYQIAIFDYKPLEPNVWHIMKLRLDKEHYRLEMDGELVSDGLHDLTFSRSDIALVMSSGHRGHGDVWKVDYLRIRPAED